MDTYCVLVKEQPVQKNAITSISLFSSEDPNLSGPLEKWEAFPVKPKRSS